jgi:outer membrane lipoprotein-sorting protein/FlaG/FlaF family flagellin (archaellin)
MPEFKFSCPQCGQHIQCDVGYAGAQINCPTCKQAILVPQAQSSSAPPPMPSRMPPPPPPMPGRAGAAAPPPLPPRPGAVRGVTAPAPAPSHAWRHALIAVAVLVVLAGLVIGAWFGYSGYKKAQASKVANPAARVSTPTADQAVQALSILSKVYSAYTNVNTLKARGTLTVYLDLSNLTLADINPNTPADAKNARRRPRGMPRTIANTTAFFVKQAPSNLFYFSGEAVSKIDRQMITNTIAYWSSDHGRFTFYDVHQPRVPATYMQLPDVNPADNTAQQFKSMQHLFADPANLAKIIKDLGQTEDETVNDQDCYTLTAKVFGQKVKIWVDKSSYLIPQWQITLGGIVSDADIDDAFSLIAAGFTNAPPAQLDTAKSQVKMMAPALAKIHGTITSTYESVEVNPMLVAADFDYDVPPGVRLMKLPNQRTPAQRPN